MLNPRNVLCVVLSVMFFGAWEARAQVQPDEFPWVLDLGVGLDVSVNGNVNSGAIGRLQNQAVAILPNPYGEIYGTGLHFRFGGGYVLDEVSELRGIFTYQSADADLVRLGDIGPSSLYAQYSDYKSIGLDLGYRRYFTIDPIAKQGIRVYAEATIGAAFVNSIDAVLAAPQTNIILPTTDFYDDSGAVTLGINVGALFPIAEQIDLNGQIGLRRVGGLSEVDQFVGSGLEAVNDDSARLTFPIVVGVRFRFR